MMTTVQPSLKLLDTAVFGWSKCLLWGNSAPVQCDCTCVRARRTYMAVYLYICSSWHSPPSLLRWWGRSSPSGISLITAVTSGINNKTAEGFININGTTTRVKATWVPFIMFFFLKFQQLDTGQIIIINLVIIKFFQKGLAYTQITVMSTLVSGPTLPMLGNSHHYALPADCSSVRDSARS